MRFTVTGSSPTLCEVGEQLSWLTSVLQPPHPLGKMLNEAELIN